MELVESLTTDGELSEDERQALLAKTEGNPLFVEETVRMLAEEGSGGIGRIPDTLQALIAARIDRLAPDAKALLQRAAVIGRIFWEGALERLSPELESLEETLEERRQVLFLARPRLEPDDQSCGDHVSCSFRGFVRSGSRRVLSMT